MQILISLLPFLLRLTLVFQGPVVEASDISRADEIAFSEDINNQPTEIHLLTPKPNFLQLARKLETEEKEVEFFDLFVDKGFKTSSNYYFNETSLAYFDYRKTRNNPHLYDLFHSWKTQLS